MPENIGSNMTPNIDPLLSKKTEYSKPTEKTFQGKSFQEIFAEQIKAVNDLKQEADQKAEDLASGKTDNVDDVLVAVKKAEIAFETMMEVRNKLVEAYEEINRMRI